MSLIYGYSANASDKSDNTKLTNSITNLSNGTVGQPKTNKEDIAKLTSTGSLTIGRVFTNKMDISSLKNGQVETNKTDIANLKSTESLTVGRVFTNKMDISSLKNGQVETNKTDITNLTAGTVGQVKTNKENIAIASNFVGSASSLEGESNLKGTELSHASAITAHSNNLLELEDLLGRKTDSAADDTAFGRIEKNKSIVVFKETSGSFVAPTNDGKVEITGWTMSENNTVIAVLLKAKKELTGLIRTSIYSGESLSDSNHLMASPMMLSDMKLGRSAVLFTGRNPRHTKMFANTRGNAVGTVAERTVSVKIVYIDHTDKT